MESLSKLITALSSLAWPVIFGLLLYKFHKPIQTLIESARGRKFTIKVAGNELTMEEASEQQRKIVNDVQSRLAEIEKRLEVSKTISLNRESKEAPPTKRILWVDDNPKNNSYLVASLQEMGHFVEIARSTDEGIRKFKESSPDIVISDMRRPEDKKAGITLTKAIHSIKDGVPIFIFCGGWAARNMREEALASGVTEITSSGTTLLSRLPLTNGS
ncbi:response regulator [Nitrosomonas communis]|uniref:Response regulator receiver domain-containing protein n=1 Tax=Nitrosomonas communis TaxID=44574 RepID=A0A1H2UH76_9PROT|nr:response regulator [Nitrosomonas communis]SDW55427.1 Response regulator receiver domain-containing protein [Nitrosomonas communis]